jgi:cation-transporting P-type ATPase F
VPLSTADREDVVHHGLPVAEVVLIAETDEATGLSTIQWRQSLCSFGAFRWQLASGATLEVARTVAVNVFVGAQIAYLVNCRSLERFRPSTGPNRWLLVGVALTVGLQLLLTYAPFMNSLFHTAPLEWQPWLVVLMLSAAAYVVVELEKWRQRQRGGGS